MKTLSRSLPLVALACWTAAAVLAQQPGPATLEGLVNSSEAQEATTAAEAGSTDAAPKRPAGTVARPKDGVQHPDLDRAWTDYGAAISKTTEAIRASIAKQFDTATEKGDLDAAEKWQVALQRFDETGQLPAESGTKAVASAATTELKAARGSLEEAYNAVVKALTREKKIAEAKAVRDELRSLLSSADLSGGDNPREPKRIAPETQNARQRQLLASTKVVGNAKGEEFADEAPRLAKVAAIAIRCGGAVDSLRVVYQMPNGAFASGNAHGGGGGFEQMFELMPGEQIVGISGRAGGVVGSIRFHTNQRLSKVYGEGGPASFEPYELLLPRQSVFEGFVGHSDNLINSIGLRYRGGE